MVGAIAPKLEQAEIERAKRKPTENLDAYDYYLRGLAGVHQWTKEGNNEALSNLYRAIELDPNFAAAYGMAARCYAQRKAGGWMTDRAQEVAEAVRLARRAVALGKDDAVALCHCRIRACRCCRAISKTVMRLIDQALVLNPNLAWAWLFSGWVKVSLGEPEVAIEHFTSRHAPEPKDPQRFQHVLRPMAMAHFFRRPL